jgi:hypothetical protein
MMMRNWALAPGCDNAIDNLFLHQQTRLTIRTHDGSINEAAGAAGDLHTRTRFSKLARFGTPAGTGLDQDSAAPTAPWTFGESF